MKLQHLLFLTAIVLFTGSWRNTNPLMKIVFFGDSITEMGVQPGGYLDRLKGMLAKAGVKDNYRVIGAGISGNKVYDLYLRLEEDVLIHEPDAVVIWVGVNDVWHKSSHGTGTDADKFEKFYVALVKKIRATGAKVIMATPAVVGERTDHSNELDGDLDKYSQIIRNIAARFDCPLADLRKAFVDYNLKNNPQNKEAGILTTDRVHLNDAGNQLVAEVFYGLLPK